MSLFVYIAMFGWIPAVLGLFALLPPRRAVITAFLAAWLFLPMAGFKLMQGVPPYTKMSATCVGVLLAAAIFDLPRFLSYRPKWVDLPMAVWCVCPFASSISNDLGAYDGLSAAFHHTVTWGLPYLIGRVYFSDAEGLRELAIGIFIGGVVYVPLCLLEVRFSPQLHYWVYGYQQQWFVTAVRWGGFRPMVFMQHGLMVSIWLASAALIGIWLWATGAMRRLGGVPMAFPVLALVLTFFLCKSAGAIVLFAAGIGALLLGKAIRSKVPLIVLLALGPAHVMLRTAGLSSGEGLTELASACLPEDRVDSLAVRLRQEDDVIGRALEHPFFGWGSWQQGQDQLWLLVFRNQGGIALAAMLATMVLPLGLLCRNRGHDLLTSPALAPALALATLLVLYMLDCLFNGMVNPVYVLAAGGLLGFLTGRPTHRRGVLDPVRTPAPRMETRHNSRQRSLYPDNAEAPCLKTTAGGGSAVSRRVFSSST